MTRLIEDFLTAEERAAIAAVLESNELRFDELVKLAQLDPKEDFKFSDLRKLNLCGADLRGFDFSGSDLRGSMIDTRTIIDETTRFLDAAVEWISAEETPIVTMMQRVQSAQSSDARRDALEKLESRFGKTDHIIAFAINAAGRAETADEFLDYAEFLPSNLDRAQRASLAQAGEKALNRKFARSRARTRREATGTLAASSIIQRLELAENSFAAEWFNSLIEALDKHPMTNALQGTIVGENKSDLIRALRDTASSE